MHWIAFAGGSMVSVLASYLLLRAVDPPTRYGQVWIMLDQLGQRHGPRSMLLLWLAGIAMYGGVAFPTSRQKFKLNERWLISAGAGVSCGWIWLWGITALVILKTVLSFRHGMEWAAAAGVGLYVMSCLWSPALAGRIARRWIWSPIPGKGYCAHCGYDLRGTPERCPECGELAPPPNLKRRTRS